MKNIVISENGQVRNLDDLELAEDIIKLRNNKNHWAVIDKLVHVWVEKAPEEESMLQINVQQYKETLKDKKFGQTLQGKDQERRFKLAFPRSLLMYIRSVYKADELKMDEKFYNEFAKRYPAFKVAEKS